MVQNPNLFSYSFSEMEKINDLPEYIRVESLEKPYYFGDEYPQNYVFNLITDKTDFHLEIFLRLPDYEKINLGKHKCEFEISLDLGEYCKCYGVFYLEVHLVSQTGEIGHFQLPFAHIKNSSRLKDCGACAHVIAYDTSENRYSIELMSKAGLTYFRDDILWENCETEKGIINVPEYYISMIEHYRKNGMEPNIILDYGNHFYDNGKAPYTEEGINAYANFTSKIAEQFKGIVSRFEIWNEYDLGGFNMEEQPPEVYAKMLKAAYTEIKKVNPEAQVIAGVTCNPHYSWLERMLAAGGSEFCDGISTHTYSMMDFAYPDDTQLQVDVNAGEYKRIVEKYGLKSKIDITEIGWSTPSSYSSCSRTQQASAIVRAFAIAQKSENIGKLLMYDFRNDGINPFDTESNWGLIEACDALQPLAPKESYVAVCCFGNMTEGCELTDSYISDGIQIIKYRIENGFRYMLWSLTGTRMLKLNITDNAVISDMYGNESNCDSEIIVCEEPCYISVSREIKFLSSEIIVPKSNRDFTINVYPERTDNGWNVKLKAYCGNRNLSGRIRIEIPQLNLKSQYDDFNLSAGECCEFSYEINEKVSSLDLYRTITDVIFSGGKREIYKEEINFISVPYGKDNCFEFLLDESSYTVLDGDDQPISAKIGLSYDEDNLYFNASVTDANHSQHGTTGVMWHDIWDGDYIELIIQPLSDTVRSDTRYNDIGLCLSSDTRKELCWRWHSAAGKTIGKLRDLPLTVTFENGITYYRAQISWKMLLPDWMPLQKCDRFGFAIRVGNSYEGCPSGLSGYLSAFGGIGDWRNPASYLPDEFGLFVLEKTSKAEK